MASWVKSWQMIDEIEELLNWITPECWWGDVSEDAIEMALRCAVSPNAVILSNVSKETVSDGAILRYSSKTTTSVLRLTAGAEYYMYPKIVNSMGTILKQFKECATHEDLLPRPTRLQIDHDVFSIHTVVRDARKLMVERWFYADIANDNSLPKSVLHYCCPERYMVNVLQKTHYRAAAVLEEPNFWGYCYSIYVSGRDEPFVVTFTTHGYTVVRKGPAGGPIGQPIGFSTMEDVIRHFKLRIFTLQEIVRNNLALNSANFPINPTEVPTCLINWIDEYRFEK